MAKRRSTPGKKSSTWKALYHDSLMDERKQIRMARDEWWKAFDNFIVTLASGAFAISLTFVVDRFEGKQVEWVCALGMAYGSFGLSISTTLYSYLTLHENLTKKVAALVSILRLLSTMRNQNEAETEKKKLETEYKSSAALTLGLNKFSFWAFVTGLLFLAVFVLKNINKV